MSDTLVNVENVSKKFCRSLKRSLWYGVRDIGVELLGYNQSQNGLPSLRRDEFWAVQNIAFELKRGDCLGLIGRNGAGKSTLLKMLNGLIKPDSGRIEMRGRIGALIELGTGFNPILTGRENIYVNGSVLGFTKKETDRKFEAIVEFAEIGDFIDMPVKNYSSGMKVRLGFAVAAQMEPDILLIDEVLAVGDLGFKAKCYNAIHEITKNAAVIFVSHSMPQIAKVCNMGLIMDFGKVGLFSRNTAEVIDEYFGRFETGSHTVGGNGKATVVNVTVADGNMNNEVEIIHSDSFGDKDKVMRFSHGISLEIGLVLKVDPTIEEFHILLAFEDMEQKLIAQSISKSSGVAFKNYPERLVQVRTKLNPFVLNKGKYGLSIVVKETGKNEGVDPILVHYRNILTFQISANSILLGAAPVQFTGDWDIEYV
jgi:lipopolysaccharide transport system ATP-binding protein